MKPGKFFYKFYFCFMSPAYGKTHLLCLSVGKPYTLHETIKQICNMVVEHTLKHETFDYANYLLNTNSPLNYFFPLGRIAAFWLP